MSYRSLALFLVFLLLGCEVERTENSTVIRAYPSLIGAQQDADRLVHDEEEFRRVLWQAVDPNFTGVRPSTIRLAADIVLASPVALGSYAYNVVIDGGGRFGFVRQDGASFDHYFDAGDHQVSDLVFRGVSFADLGFGGAIIMASSSAATLERLGCIDCTLSNNLLGTRSTLPTARAIIYDNRQAEGGVGMDFAGEARIGSFLWQRYSDEGDELGLGLGTAWVRGAVEGTLSGGGSRVTANPGGVEVIGGAAIEGKLRFVPSPTTLSGVGPTLTPTNVTFVPVTVDATASGTITIAAGASGQLLVLTFPTVDGTAKFVDGAGNFRSAAGDYTPVVDGSLTLIYDATSAVWRELARTPNASGGASVSDITLSGKGPTLDLTGLTYARIRIDSSAMYEITIVPGADGQRVTLSFVSVAGTALFADGLGRFQGAGDFTPSSNDTLDLVYDADLDRWLEVGRSVN